MADAVGDGQQIAAQPRIFLQEFVLRGFARGPGSFKFCLHSKPIYIRLR